MGNKKKKKCKFTLIVAEISNDCKSNVSAHKVGEFKTILVGKGITGIASTVFNEMENKNEDTSLLKLADVAVRNITTEA